MAINRIPNVLLAFFFILFFNSVLAQRTGNGHADVAKKAWVDSVYNKLSPEERIGQLFMVAAYSGGKDYNEPAITALVNNNQIGGLIFMQGTPAAQAVQNNKYQQLSKVPLLIGMDAEWGLGMRLTGVRDFPRAMMIGATKDSLTAYRIGYAIAEQCKRLGVHIDFAPVVDINNNPNNPIINARSFGEDKKWVARLGVAYMLGLQDNGVMACAKHFPGHGDTETDSHKDLPVIRKSLKQLDTLEFYPFKALIKAGLRTAMVAHLEVPVMEQEAHIPTTLSKNTITNILKKQLGFSGLVFTDALNMQGVTKYFQPGEVDLRAFIAGNDMLLFSQNVPVAIQKFKEALDRGTITEKDIEARVKKILAAKYDAGLNHVSMVDTTNILDDLNKYADILREQVATKAVTLVKDESALLARMHAADGRIAYIGVNATESVLYDQLRNAIPDLRYSWIPKGSVANIIDRIKQSIRGNDVTIVGIHNLTFYPMGGSHGMDAQQVAFLKDIANEPNVFFVLMGNAYLAKNFCDAGSIMIGYEDDSITQTVAANILLRKTAAQGKLPVTPCPGMTTEEEEEVKPEIIAQTKEYPFRKTEFVQDAGVTNTEALDKLSMFIQRSIVAGAFPGCRVLAAKNGKIFYDEAFGYYTYSKENPVQLSTMYDVASVTKVLATTLAVMRLYEQGKIRLDKTLGDYLKWTRGTDKANLVIRDLLLHQAGLKSWIPFYKETLDETGNLKDELYANKPRQGFNIPVTRDIFLRNDYVDTVWSRILTSPLENKGRYVYSDLDYYFLAAVVEQVSGKKINEYVEEQFYKPMGLKRIAYLPLKKFGLTEIAPTENDVAFRKELIQGYVHDPGSALFGGVAGHAGIFAQAYDVGAIFQMLLNGGVFNGKRYFKTETVTQFTAYNSRISRRGLGFDKPSADKTDGGPAGNRVSGYAFGHQGFTGTCAWADPATGIVFVFLSNRVYPSADNNNINRLSVRTVVQDYIYQAFGIKENHARPEVYKKQVSQNK